MNRDRNRNMNGRQGRGIDITYCIYAIAGKRLVVDDLNVENREKGDVFGVLP